MWSFRRDRKKAVNITASLNLDGILLLLVSSALLTRSPEQAARLFFPDGDYKVYLSSQQPEEEIMASSNPLDEELRREIMALDGVTDVLATRQSIHARFGTSVHASAGMCDMLTDANRGEVESALVSGAMPTDAHSILLDMSNHKYYEDMDVGAVIESTFGQRTTTVTISGLFDSHQIMNGHGALTMDTAVLFAPEELFRELYPEIENFDYSWSIVSDPAKADEVEGGLQELLSSRGSLGLDTIGEHIEYEKMQSSIIFGGMQALSWLIFLFDVVNLINTTLSNQISRKRENSILRSIGQTWKQQCLMNLFERLCYALCATLAVFIVGLPIAAAVCREVSKRPFVGEIVPYQFPALEMGLFVLVQFGMGWILSAWTANRQRKQSLIEQMRETK